MPCLGPKTARQNRAFSHIFFHPDYTVGYGIAPYQPPVGLAGSTAGGESHPALKIFYLLPAHYSAGKGRCQASSWEVQCGQRVASSAISLLQ